MSIMNKKKIIFIMGAGRSGTTLLDIMLGNNPEILSAGELNRFPRNNGIPAFHEARKDASEFWNSISRKLNEQFGSINFEQLTRESYNHEYHIAFLSFFFKMKPSISKYYSEFIINFWKTIFNSINQEIVIDSSKYPMRGIVLSELLPYDIAFIYLKRNPIMVCRSFAKKDVGQPRLNWIKCNVYLLIVNLVCKLVYRKLNKKHTTMILHYESLIENPVQALKNISEKLNIDLKQSIEIVQNSKPLKTGLLFDGNRMIAKPEIVLRENETGIEKMNFLDHITLFIQSFWWKKDN